MFSKDVRVLFICESPEKAKTITKIFKKAGYNNIVVMATIGHFVKIKDGSGYCNTGVHPEKDFAIDYEIDPGKYQVVNKIKEQVKIADLILLAADPDREGSVIAWECKEFLKIPNSKYKRVTYQAVNEKAILQAIEDATTIDQNMVDAGHTRGALDITFGYRLSNVVKTNVNCKSAGRCQSPTLGLLVHREEEIINFKPEKYWDLYLLFEKNKTEFKAKYQGTDKNPLKHLDNQEQVENVFKECKGNDFIVKSVDHKDRFDNPRPPFSTNTYLQECANKLGLTAKQAADCAQQLFDAGKISYHRTDATFVSEEFQEETKKFITKRFKDSKLFTKPEESKKTGLEQEGHECLRILDWELTPEKLQEEGFSSMQVKVYRMIYVRTLQSMLPAAIYSWVQYTIANGKHLFKFETKELKYEGYKMVKNTDVQENDEVES